ncbi:MAG TPA: OB-fold nucleic acid binding domain-containing protein, partial [Cyclobacteriaceae bacterium]|nr:OB-fold nucleic acid binding domain-containing protein [Cyclobacteriaceae bacterium]
MPFFDTSIEFLKGVGTQRAALLQKELKIFTFGDLLEHYPFRYEDRTRFYQIREVTEEMPYVQIVGRITRLEIAGMGFKKRLVGKFTDGTESLELVWFKGIPWVLQKIKPNIEYVIFGKPNRFGKTISIAHPEIEPASTRNTGGGHLQPIYSLSEKLRNKYLDSKFISKLEQELLRAAQPHIHETLPDSLLKRLHLIGKKE